MIDLISRQPMQSKLHFIRGETMFKIFIISLFLLMACTKNSGSNAKSSNSSAEISPLSNTLDQCRKNSKDCAAIDIEKAEAKEAYQIGCDANDFYSCFRLGQYYETKALNMEEAVKAYGRSCTGKDSYGCEGELELRSKLCFLEKKKEFCKDKPTGEYRILVFLESFESEYQDAFISHNFSEPFLFDQTKKLYEKRIAEKNKKLLAALRAAKKQGKHDGADAKSLQADIWKLEGNEKMLEGTGL